MPDPTVVLEASAKALLYASLLLVIGASAARWLLLPRVGGELGTEGIAVVERSVARLALLAAVGVVAASGLRVWTHTVAAFGFEGARSRDALELVAVRSRWGSGWRPQMAAAFVLVLASAVTVWRRTAWLLATPAALVMTAVIPRLGHAAGDMVRMAVHTVHLFAGGLWVGTLAVVLLARLPPSIPAAIDRALTRQHVRALILRSFWPIALSGSAAAAAAGVVMALWYVGSWTNLSTTAYGRVLLLKVGLVGTVAVCGGVNWRRLHRSPETGHASLSIAVLESVLALAVVIVTGYLTEIGHP